MSLLQYAKINQFDFSAVELQCIMYACLSHIYPRGGDKVCMLTHTYLHKPLKKIKVTLCNHKADSLLYVWLDVWSGDLQV